MSRDTFSDLSTLTHRLREAIFAELSRSRSTSVWYEHEERFCRQTGATDRLAFADAVAQSLACSAVGWHSFADRLSRKSASWLVDSADPLVADILRLGYGPPLVRAVAPGIQAVIQRIVQLLDNHIDRLSRQLPATPNPSDAAVYFYERFLTQYDPDARRGKGVFYTPPALVAFVVRTVDQLLVDEFFLCHGLADTATLPNANTSPETIKHPAAGQSARQLRVLDPAMGTGAFLLAVTQRIAERVRGSSVFRNGRMPHPRPHPDAGDTANGATSRPVSAASRTRAEIASGRATPQDPNDLWNDYVVSHLLPRLWGQEILLPPLVLAQMAMAAWLADSGFRFERPGKLHLYLANTLAQPHVGDATRSCSVEPFTIVLGNPPFSGVSDNRQAWIRQLLRGHAPGCAQEVASYFLAQGQPLGERKHWLEDDYVKFMRFAHWQIERAGTGIVALVTNHGYLENTTFRGMREQLLATFPLIDVVDMHGNSRNADRTPEGRNDESLFGIEQGVAVSFLRRPVAAPVTPRIRRAELWGTRSAKIQTLARHSAQTLPHTSIDPQPPHFFIADRANRLQREYDAGVRLCEAMPTHSTAVVTARDGFIVAFDTDELCERIEQFVNVDYTDDQIRQRFFGNGRSRKYRPGDTRGWQLTDARRRLMQHPDWSDSVRSCLYRPFDYRQILWLPWMIDWPRREVMDHLCTNGNLALIARRQMPPAASCDYFWVTDRITLDGVVRSDNRGSESVFPLFLLDAARIADGTSRAAKAVEKRPNFSDSFIHYCTKRLQLDWSPDSADGLQQKHALRRLTPESLFYYVYGLFHCPSYRRRFAERLRIDFPHILVPRQPALFVRFARLGQTLVQTHLLAADQRRDLEEDTLSHFALRGSEGNTMVEAGYPKYAHQSVWLNATSRFSKVGPAIWHFRVGTYQVCRKWLRDRRQRHLTLEELQHYAQMLAAIDTTIRTTANLDRLLESHGGWETAF